MNHDMNSMGLAATIPYRRYLSFWAKSTMFANPVAAQVMSSTGAIPVKRNLNAGGSSSSKGSGKADEAKNGAGNSASKPQQPSTQDRASLFSSTCDTLRDGGVIGVFPEGTSYTQSRIVQVMSGAGWAGVEYLKFWRERAGKLNEGRGGEKARRESGLKIVPVAIVYSDKARYRSRIYVRYGTPICMDDYVEELSGDGQSDEVGVDVDERSKEVVKKVTKRVEEALVGMTVNADDWDIICATTMARTILWGDEEGVPLKRLVEVSQRLVQELSLPPKNVDPELAELHKSLTKYYALLHYTNTRHSILTSLVPLSVSTSSSPTTPASAPATSSSLSLPSVTHLNILTSTLRTLPLTFLFIPSFVLFAPGYITGALSKRFLAVKGEEESGGQFGSVGGGLGVGLGLGVWVGVIRKMGGIRRVLESAGVSRVLEWVSDTIGRMGWLSGRMIDVKSVVKAVVERAEGLGVGAGGDMKMRTGFVVALAAVWMNTYVLAKVHSLLVDANYRM
ncbi:hypothetical protein CVT24_011394 [Panaeolus cyanescens]|uniref:Phospholipid/glycerol acyltransferase domain-containing protein n=1 Tax=Panaeolus cyanescens TaxID=181874 RepID=A0A409YGP8_9AGAR|nr:hypothetical protein CVT24_011394 [Panaeolus cyanescens]